MRGKRWAIGGGIVMGLLLVFWLWLRYETRNLGDGIAIAVRELVVVPMAKVVGGVAMPVVDVRTGLVQRGMLTLREAPPGSDARLYAELVPDEDLASQGSIWWKESCARVERDTIYLLAIDTTDAQALIAGRIRVVAGSTGGGYLPLCRVRGK